MLLGSGTWSLNLVSHNYLAPIIQSSRPQLPKELVETQYFQSLKPDDKTK